MVQQAPKVDGDERSWPLRPPGSVRTGKGGPVPGTRYGGRAKGTVNKRTQLLRDLAQDGKLTPLEFMLRVMRDETKDTYTRLDAAKAAAPFVHPKLTAIEHSGGIGGAGAAGAPPAFEVVFIAPPRPQAPGQSIPGYTPPLADAEPEPVQPGAG